MKGESQHAMVMVEELLLGKEEIFASVRRSSRVHYSQY